VQTALATNGKLLEKGRSILCDTVLNKMGSSLIFEQKRAFSIAEELHCPIYWAGANKGLSKDR
jgi:hypothetical protein